MTAQQVLDAFVAKYGEKALMAPKPQGFNLAGYLVPGAAIAAAGAALMLLSAGGRRWRPRQPAGAGPAARGEPGGDGAAAAGPGRGGGLMALEVVAAALVGLAVVWLILQPLLAPEFAARPPSTSRLIRRRRPGAWRSRRSRRSSSTGRPASSPTRTTSSSSGKYTGAALEALRAESADAAGTGDAEAMIAARVRALRSAATSAPPEAPACPTCGPRPEPDAVFCSTCGRRIAEGGACAGCGAALGAGLPLLRAVRGRRGGLTRRRRGG